MDTATMATYDGPTFRDMADKIRTPFLQALDDMGFKNMSPVQAKVLRELPSTSSDCLVQAKTGTGKTVAFLLPALQHLLDSPPPKGKVGILVLSPTRELAMQIAAQCNQLTARLPHGKKLECHTAFGGTNKDSNLKKFLTGNPSVLVATPGRLNDYLSEARTRERFARLRTVVLDEADRMLEQGFLVELKNILKSLPPKSTGWQGMCFSATVPPKVQDVVSTVLKPGYTTITTIEEDETPTIDLVTQYSVIVPSVKDTFNALAALLKLEQESDPNNFKAIIFGSTANGVALKYNLFTELYKSTKVQVYQLQSRMTQSSRTRTTAEFKAASNGLMFASDVIGRGMDFPNVGHVIQVGLPSNKDQYVHRVGRTARAGNEGRAVILLTSKESNFVTKNKHLPIGPYPIQIDTHSSAARPAVEEAFTHVDETTKSKAYSAYLGFNKTFTKDLGLKPEGLVQMANELADTMGCPEPPMLQKTTVGKMGLKGVKGLRIGQVDSKQQRQHPKKSNTSSWVDSVGGGGVPISKLKTEEIAPQQRKAPAQRRARPENSGNGGPAKRRRGGGRSAPVKNEG